VLALASILNNVVVASSVQGVSRVIARSLDNEREAFRAVFRVHLPLAIVLALTFAGLAPTLARFEGAPHIARPLMLMALVVLLYGTYAPVVGLLNGRGEFTRQASLDVAFAVLRTVAMVTLGWFFVARGWPGVMGATLGFMIAAVCVVPLALRLALPLRPSLSGGSVPTPRDYLAELWPLAAAQLCTNAVMQVDITMLGHFLSPQNSGGAGAALADEWVGVYRACQLFAFLPYQLLLSITQVLFPMLARARAEGDSARVRLYVERGARLAAVLSGIMVSVLVAMPTTVLRFAYTQEIADRGGPTLRILAIGQGAYTMLAIATTILSSLGHERRAFRVTFGALVAVLVGCVGLTSRAAFGEEQLRATAIATTVGLTITLVVAAREVHRATGGFVPFETVGRVLLALGLAGGVGSFLPAVGRLLTPIAAGVVGLVYVAVLVGTRELTRADVHALRALRD
jgi:stage V sporulation protein B